MLLVFYSLRGVMGRQVICNERCTRNNDEYLKASQGIEKKPSTCRYEIMRFQRACGGEHVQKGKILNVLNIYSEIKEEEIIYFAIMVEITF